MNKSSKYTVFICASVLVGALFATAEQQTSDQQIAAMFPQDEEAQLPPEGQSFPFTREQHQEEDEDPSTSRDFSADASAIADGLCKNAPSEERPYTCVRSEDGKVLTVTFTSDSSAQGQVVDLDLEYAARQLAQVGREEDAAPHDGEEEPPSSSYLGPYGEEISREEYERLAELEMKHEREGTLHLLYPDIYEEGYQSWYDRLAEDRDEEDSEEGEEEAKIAQSGSDVEGERSARDAVHEAL